MERHIIALDLFLKEMNVDRNIQSLNDRKRIQKAVYLAQQKIDLGYKYNWYVKGPYSPSLTQDYYQLADAPEPEFSLKQSIKDLLAPIRGLISEKAVEGMEDHNWLELLASYHFLRTASKKDHEGATQTLKDQKPHVADYAEEARKALVEEGLLED